MGRVFAYCRVSTQGQSTKNQVREIAGAGFAIAPHRVSKGRSADRLPPPEEGFQKLLDRMERGDVLVAAKLDRLGRNVIDVVSTIEKLANLGVRTPLPAIGRTGPHQRGRQDDHDGPRRRGRVRADPADRADQCRPGEGKGGRQDGRPGPCSSRRRAAQTAQTNKN